MCNECAAGLTRAGDDVDHAVGQFGFLQNLGEMQRSNGSRFRRLQHARVPAGQRRRELPSCH